MPTPINDDAVELLLLELPRTCDEQTMRDALAVRDWRKVLSYAPKDSTIREGLFVPEGYPGGSLRFYAFTILGEYMNDHAYWQYLGQVWTECEKKLDEDQGRSLLEPQGRELDERPLMMTAAEKAALDALPDSFTIYRGGRRGGWCWTTSRTVAQAFGSTEGGFEMLDEKGNPITEDEEPDDVVGFHTAIIQKKDVIAYFLRKNEDEIVVNWKKLRIQ